MSLPILLAFYMYFANSGMIQILIVAVQNLLFRHYKGLVQI